MAVMLTTIDNPFDPRKDFGAWYAWDVEQGYNSCAYLARVAAVAEEFPEDVQHRHIEMAVDEIIQYNGNLYKKLEVDAA